MGGREAGLVSQESRTCGEGECFNYVKLSLKLYKIHHLQSDWCLSVDVIHASGEADGR